MQRAAALLLLIPAVQFAQPQPQVAEVRVDVQGPGINPNAMAGKDAQEGVFVRDSARWRSRSLRWRRRWNG